MIDYALGIKDAITESVSGTAGASLPLEGINQGLS